MRNLKKPKKNMFYLKKKHPTGSNTGGNNLLKFHHWKNNVVVITFSNVSVDNSSVCGHTVKTYVCPT